MKSVKSNRSTSAPVTELSSVSEIDKVFNSADGGRLRRMLDRCEQRMAEAISGYGSLSEDVSETLNAGGKRLRPMLVFICSGKAEGDELVRVAAAVELVHTASLVHDDVLDASHLRRGAPTIFSTKGPEIAAAAGDLLFSRAVALVAANCQAEQVRVLAGACHLLAEGELAQRRGSYNYCLSEDEYMSRIAGKTASLFEAACELAALAGSLSEAREEMAVFGRNVGLAFQIVDDVLDVAGEKSATGKSTGEDLKSGTVTLPYILAREQVPELRELEKSLATGEKVDLALDLIAGSEVLERCLQIARGLVADGIEAIDRASIPGRTRETLEAVAHASISRAG